MRIAVLGATGVAGRAFVPRAAVRGHSLATARTDIFDRDALVSLLKGCDAAVNLATSIPKPGGRGDWKVNDRIRREGTANLIASCLDAGVRVLVQQSVAMLHCVADDRPQTENDPIEGYGVLVSAFDMEVLALASPLDVRIVRGGLFYGPGTGREERWLEQVRNPAFRIPGSGRAWVSPVHVEDYAVALLEILARGQPRTAYIACDDAPLCLHELYGRLAAKAGAERPALGGPASMRSFRVNNCSLRSLGWVPSHPRLRF